jgi:SAM-dependent methyltransferase
MNSETVKYQGLYASNANYGHMNHGSKALPLLIKWCPTSVLDVGCGGNEFIKSFRAENPKIKAFGMDFASPFADILSDVASIPAEDKEYDVITSFDMLEHLTPEQVDPVLREMSRVSKRFIFSISYVPSKRLWEGQNLHPTVRPESWWIRKIVQAGGIGVKVKSGYIIGGWQTLFQANPSTTCVLVGNGPSLLDKDKGEQIDAFDEIVRFNRYILKGFESKIGTRTTLWSTYGNGRLPLTADERPTRVIYTHGESGSGPAYKPEHLYSIPHWFWAETTRDLRAFASWECGFDMDAPKLIPTSGLMVAAWLLQIIGFSKVSLVGFDHFRKTHSKRHHYWDERAFKKPKEHNGEVEAAMFSCLMEKGKVEYL